MVIELHLVKPFFCRDRFSGATINFWPLNTKPIHPRFGDINSGIPQSKGKQITRMMADTDPLLRRSDISILLPENGGDLKHRMQTVDPHGAIDVEASCWIDHGRKIPTHQGWRKGRWIGFQWSLMELLLYQNMVLHEHHLKHDACSHRLVRRSRTQINRLLKRELDQLERSPERWSINHAVLPSSTLIKQLPLSAPSS